MMRLNFDLPLLEHMSEGLVLLNRQGQVVSHNRAAGPWVPRCHAMLGGFKSLIDEEIKGRVALPLRIGLWSDKTQENPCQTEAWLIQDGRRDYAVFLASSARPPVAGPGQHAPSQVEVNHVTLLGDEVRLQMTVLRKLLQTQAGNPARDEAAIVAQSSRVDQLLQEIADLSQLMQQDEVFMQDRIVLSDLIEQLLPTLPQHPNRVAFNPDNHQQGVVYGHTAWLRYALRVLLESLVNSAPPNSHVDMATSQLGNFMVLTGRVSAINPLHARNTQPGRSPSAQGPAVEPGQQRSAAIQQVMCQRIIALHAGQLKLDFMPPTAPGGDPKSQIESFTLTLGTGQPVVEQSRVSCASCPHPLQTLAYAADLASLLSPQFPLNIRSS